MEALRLILRHLPKPALRDLALDECAGLILGRSLKAPFSLPHWDNAAMDGFALASAESRGATRSSPALLAIHGAVRAGDPPLIWKRLGCTRIMTGAPIPRGLDTILPVEQSRIENDHLVLEKPLPPGRHVRTRGEDFRKGAIVLPKGSFLSPGALGLAASLGLGRVPVHPRPGVALISSGDELTPAGKKLVPGKIYDANGPMLAAALVESGAQVLRSERVPDSPSILRTRLASALRAADLVILSGGVSMGDFDHSRRVLATLGVRRLFWGVSQKPGKPLFFGKKGRTLVFGLPGNPASALVCFHEYVRPALQALLGRQGRTPSEILARSPKALRPDPTKTLFLRGRYAGIGGDSQVEILRGQGSHQVSALALANCLVVVPPGRRTPGQVVLHPFPGPSLS